MDAELRSMLVEHELEYGTCHLESTGCSWVLEMFKLTKNKTKKWCVRVTCQICLYKEWILDSGTRGQTRMVMVTMVFDDHLVGLVMKKCWAHRDMETRMVTCWYKNRIAPTLIYVCCLVCEQLYLLCESLQFPHPHSSRSRVLRPQVLWLLSCLTRSRTSGVTTRPVDRLHIISTRTTQCIRDV